MYSSVDHKCKLCWPPEPGDLEVSPGWLSQKLRDWGCVLVCYLCSALMVKACQELLLWLLQSYGTRKCKSPSLWCQVIKAWPLGGSSKNQGTRQNQDIRCIKNLSSRGYWHSGAWQRRSVKMAAIREKKKQTWHLTAEARQKERMKMRLSFSIPDEYSSRHLNVC